MDEQNISNETLLQRTQEFCAITDRSSGIDFAIDTASRFHNYEEIEEAWECVRDILEHPLNGDEVHFSKIENVLGAKVVVKLYRYYLKVHKNRNIQADYLKSSNELVEYIKKAQLSESEFLELYTLLDLASAPGTQSKT